MERSTRASVGACPFTAGPSPLTASPTSNRGPGLGRGRAGRVGVGHTLATWRTSLAHSLRTSSSVSSRRWRRASIVASCRPHHSPRATPDAVVAQVLALRRQRWTGARIAPAVALSRATIGRRLRRHGALHQFAGTPGGLATLAAL